MFSRARGHRTRKQRLRFTADLRDEDVSLLKVKLRDRAAAILPVPFRESRLQTGDPSILTTFSLRFSFYVRFRLPTGCFGKIRDQGNPTPVHWAP